MATQNGKLGKAIKRAAGKVKKAAHKAKRAVKKRTRNAPFDAGAVKRARKVQPLARVRRKDTGALGTVIGAKSGFLKIKWDDAVKPAFAAPSSLQVLNDNPRGRSWDLATSSRVLVGEIEMLDHILADLKGKPGEAAKIKHFRNQRRVRVDHLRKLNRPTKKKNGRWVGRKTGLRKALTLTQRIAKGLPLDANAVYTKASNTLRQRMKAKGYHLDHAIDAWVVRTNPAKAKPGVALGDRAKNAVRKSPKPGVALGDRTKNAAKRKPGVALGDRAKNAPARNGKKRGAGSRKAKTVVRAKVIKKLVINPVKNLRTLNATQLLAQLDKARHAQLLHSGTQRAAVYGRYGDRIEREIDRRASTKLASKKNPPKSGGAVRKEFLGRDSTKLSKVNVSRHMPIKPTPDILAQLNEVKIKGRGVIKMPRGAKLIADHRKRIWFSEHIAKPNPAQDKNTVEPVGEIVHVVYTARKEPRTDALGQTHFGEAKAIPYIHRLGEDSGKRPTLYVDDEGYGVIKGGNYSIDWRGIID